MLLKIIPTMNDELLYSYLYRTMLANGLSDMRSFLCYILDYSEKKRFGKSFAYNMPKRLWRIFEILKIPKTEQIEFFFKTSLANIYFPTLTEYAQTCIIDCMSKDNEALKFFDDY